MYRMSEFRKEDSITASDEDRFLSETLKSDYLKTMLHYKPSCACILSLIHI